MATPLSSQMFGQPSREREGGVGNEKEQTIVSPGLLDVAGVSDDLRRSLLAMSFGLQNFPAVEMSSRQLFFVGPPGVEKTTLAKALLQDVTENSNEKVKVIYPKGDMDLTKVFESTLFEAKTAATRGRAVVLFLDEAQKTYFSDEGRPEMVGKALSLWSQLIIRDNVFIIGTATTRDVQELGRESAFWGRMPVVEVGLPAENELADLIAHFIVRINDGLSTPVFAPDIYDVCADYVDSNAEYWDFVTSGKLFDTSSDQYVEVNSARNKARKALLRHLSPVLDTMFDESEGKSMLSHREILEMGINPLVTKFTTMRAYQQKHEGRRQVEKAEIHAQDLAAKLRERVIANIHQDQSIASER